MIEQPPSLNPLSEFQSYTVKHVIVGFKFSEDACTFDITGDVGVSGTEIDNSSSLCKGPGIVIINELEDPTFVMYEAETYWNYFSQSTPTSGSYSGYMHINDRVGMLFAQRLREYCKKLGMALGHITFSWKTFFIGNLPNGDIEVIHSNPMIFHITDFAQSLSPYLGRSYIMNFVSSYNTYGQLPQFSKMFQTSLTHADGNVHQETPSTTNITGTGILSREEEDKLRSDMRKIRNDKSKPMKNLLDIFNSLQVELTNQSLPNKTQIQDWQVSIRDDYSKKLTPPKQYLPELPLKYTIKIEDKFSSYKLDNRNLPFEQPEQDQRLEGLRVLPFHLGTDLNKAVDSIMMLSKSVGRDFTGESPTGYRSTTTVLRECSGGYNIHTNINSYKIPINRTDGIDTGPGDGVIGGPLEYVWQDSKGLGKDIISINYRSNVVPVRQNLEQSPDDSSSSGVVYGNREPISIQRLPQSEDDFFTSGYSGNRGAIAMFEINGLESSDNASIIKTALSPSSIKQSTSYNISIVGNPVIMNDINRNPLDVRAGIGMKDSKNGEQPKWNYKLYDKPEYIPMYLKLTIYLNPESYLGNGEPLENQFFYSGYLHITKIKTSFTQSKFTQTIEGVRTEDSI